MSQFIHALDTANKRVKAINCDENGNLQVDVVSMTGGGDATAANQVTNHGKLDSVITKLGEIDTVLDSINSGTGAAGNLEGIRDALLTDIQGKLDHLSDDIDAVDATLGTTNNKLDTLDGSVNTIEACVAAGELAVAHSGLTELATAINSQKLDVNIASDGASLATSANQATANGHLTDIKGTHYADGDAVGVADKGQLVMGKDASGNAHPLQCTANGDLDVEIADFVKGQAPMASSFPVTIASNQSTLNVNISSDSASLATSANQSTTHTKLDTIDGSINTIEACVSSNELAISHSALTELAAAINSSKVDVSDLDALSALNGIATDVSNSKPDLSQSTLESGSTITAGSNTSEIDMDGYRHLTIYGSSTTNFGSWCLVRRQQSAGTDYLDGSNMFSASDPTGGTSYHVAATFENVGNRYVAFRNLDTGSQTVTFHIVKSR